MSSCWRHPLVRRDPRLGYASRVEPLVDSWGRAIESLRVSVTDKCNFRCTYCMPAEGLEWLPKREVLSFEEIERLKPYVVRFIEFMPLDADEVWREDRVLTGGEIRELIEERWPLVELPAAPSSTARRFRFAEGSGEIGFVNPVSEPFCSACDRIRLTADGQLRTCLFSRREWDLKGPLRAGTSDEGLERHIRFAVRHKELKHRISDAGFVRASRSMSQIGG